MKGTYEIMGLECRFHFVGAAFQPRTSSFLRLQIAAGKPLPQKYSKRNTSYFLLAT
jgi:hypothetical protein